MRSEATAYKNTCSCISKRQVCEHLLLQTGFSRGDRKLCYTWTLDAAKIVLHLLLLAGTLYGPPWIPIALRDFRLPLRSGWELRSSVLFRNGNRQFLTYVSGQPIGPIFKSKKSCPWRRDR